MGHGEELLTLRHSRKSYLLEYGCGIFLLGLLLIASLKGIELPFWASYLVVGMAFATIGSAEFGRYFGDRYKIQSTKLSIIKGVINIKKKNIYYHPLGFIPDLNISQTTIQRLLGYGTVFVVVGGDKFEIRNVDNPHNVLKIIEDLVEDNRHVNSEQYKTKR